jgi:hypothetical protein
VSRSSRFVGADDVIIRSQKYSFQINLKTWHTVRQLTRVDKQQKETKE